MDNLQIELVNVVDKKVVTTSLKVAEMFDKRHDNVLRDIKDLLEVGEIDALHFEVISYKDSMNRDKPMYLIDRDGFTLLAMGFTGKEALKFKVQYIQAFNKMEEELVEKTKFQLPTTFAQALQLAATQAEELEKQQLLLEEQKPKVVMYDTIIASDKLFSMNEVAKLINSVGRNKLFKMLRDAKILMLDNNPYQKYVDMGYFKVVEVTTTDGSIYVATRATNKGIEFICKRLNLTCTKTIS